MKYGYLDKEVKALVNERDRLAAENAELERELAHVKAEWAECSKTLCDYRKTSEWHVRQTSGGDAPEGDLYSTAGLLATNMDYLDAERVATAFGARVGWLTDQISEWSDSLRDRRNELAVTTATLDKLREVVPRFARTYGGGEALIALERTYFILYPPETPNEDH